MSSPDQPMPAAGRAPVAHPTPGILPSTALGRAPSPERSTAPLLAILQNETEAARGCNLHLERVLGALRGSRPQAEPDPAPANGPGILDLLRGQTEETGEELRTLAVRLQELERIISELVER